MVNGVANTGQSTAANQTSQSQGMELDNTFLTLLMAELKSQDPTSPVDPTTMVGQMVSLNQLNELIGIRGVLQSMSADSATTGSTSASGRN